MKRQPQSEVRIEGWWDIARVGKWSGSQGGRPVEIEITREDIEEMAAAYSPGFQEAPVTVEHLKEGPAHGWVDALRVVGDRLQARFKDISDSLRRWLRTGAYRSRSIEMYKPFTATGKAYLAAVSFLGAAAPAVKGLSPEPELFSEDRGAQPGGRLLRLDSQTMELNQAPSEGVDKMDDKTFAERVVGSLREFFSAGDAETGNRLLTLERQLEETRKSLAGEKNLRIQAEEKAAAAENRLEEQRREAELAGFAEALSRAEAEQRLTPAEAAGYLKLGSSLDEAGRSAILEEVAERRPLSLFRELSAPAVGLPAGGGSLERQRSRFQGFPEDPEHDAALELMAGRPELSFSEAISLVRERQRAAG
ncbi:MAG: hypothetical protein JXQ83_15315 [Candidatus Glassbacteria bacterium]|nr:hypothetical protein [Candidatus Glassbacteria bacterium]